MELFEIDSLLKLAPREFEELIRTLLTKMQFNASTTKISGDGGIDIIAVSEQPIVGGRYVIQCKKYTPGNNVGEPIVRELYGAMMHENANKGILITTSDFTKQAISFSQNKAIELINGNNIISLLNRYITKMDDAIKEFSPNIGGTLFERWSSKNTLTNSETNEQEKRVRTIEQAQAEAEEREKRYQAIKRVQAEAEEREKSYQAIKQAQEQGKQAIKQAVEMRFLFSDLIIQDKKTGLIWPKQANMGGGMRWSVVLEYLSNMNSDLYAGRSDWRLPSLDELKTIIDFAKSQTGYEKDISSLLKIIGFRNVAPAYYWTSTGDASAYIISMIDGNTYVYDKSYNYGYNILPVSVMAT